MKCPQFTGVTDTNVSNVEAVDSGSITWHDYFANGLKQLEESNDDNNAALLQFYRDNLHKADSIDAELARQYGANTGEDGGTGNSFGCGINLNNS